MWITSEAVGIHTMERAPHDVAQLKISPKLTIILKKENIAH